MEYRKPTRHRMTRRCAEHDYSAPGLYHITIHVAEELGMPLGQVVGNPTALDGTEEAPHVLLSDTGEMVEQELTHAIESHYKMIEVQDHIVMPEHIHAILEVHDPIIAPSGKPATLGQVIAGFKKGCNKRYWEIISQEGEALRENRSGTNQDRQPAPITATSDPAGAAMGAAESETAGADRLLLITPWQYHYSPADTPITRPACKAMNCLAQALCRTKDSWWKTLKP